MNSETGKQLKYCNIKQHQKYKETWKRSYGNKIGRLAQGMQGRVKETNTMFFIQKMTFHQTESATSHTEE